LLSNGGNRIELFDLNQFRPKRKDFCFARQFAWMFWVERHPLQVMPNTQPHQVIASKLLPGQTITVVFAELPGPGQVLVSNPLIQKVAIRPVPGQDIPDQLQQTMGNHDNRLVPVHPVAVFQIAGKPCNQIFLRATLSLLNCPRPPQRQPAPKWRIPSGKNALRGQAANR
jgi:hypothetical protein